MLFLRFWLTLRGPNGFVVDNHNHNVHGSNRSHFAKTPLVNLFYSFLNIKYFYIHWGLNPVFEWPCYSASFGKFKWAIFCSKIYPYVPRYLIAITGFQMFRSLLLSFDWMSLETTKNGFHFSVNPSLIFCSFSILVLYHNSLTNI